MKKETFSENLGTTFRVAVPDHEPVDLRLSEVSDLAAPPEYESFAVRFEGPADAFVPQATYDVSHPTAGEFPLFVVPIGRGENGFLYEAIFNRRREA